MNETRGTVFGLCLAFLLGSCTINIGTKESTPASVEITESDGSIESSTTAVTLIDPQTSWIELGVSENSISQGSIVETENGMFGLLAAPTLKLYEFGDGKWAEIGMWLDNHDPMGSRGLEPGSLDFPVTIQSVDITQNGSIDWVIMFEPAPWHSTEAPMRGTTGLVLTCDDGDCRLLDFWEPENYGSQGEIHTHVEYIYYADETLFASWFGSCGRPCGILTYNWNREANRLEGKEATKRQNARFREECGEFKFTDKLPLKLCNEGQAVQYLQDRLFDWGFEVDRDGFFGRDTRVAVQFFQRSKNIRATGEVDLATWSALFEGIIIPGYDLNNDGLITPDELPGD